tara:strand:+ start:2476 stop:3846 length:1371 start_codon:yes stop_codon:yes gene_type:complete
MVIKKKTHDIFYLFLLSHLTIWTFVPSLSNINLPLDTIEALAWGSNLDWGFNKHPPLSAFVVEVFYKIFGNQDWAYYFLSQIFIIISFIVVYKFADEFFNSKKLALISVFLLEGIFFYNFTTPEFNVNVCQIPFWSLSIYFCWRCIKFEKTQDYILLGIFIGLGILSKYLFVYLVLGIKAVFIYLIFKKKKKISGKYFIVAPVVLFILIPHINWLISNEYSTILYGLKRTGGIGDFTDHLVYPLIFLAKQIFILIPFLIMSLLLIKKFKLKINFKDEKLIFLICTTLMPILFILLTSMIMGAKIRTMWMTPFYIFFGIFIIYLIKDNLKRNLKKFYLSFLFLFLLSPALYLTISLLDETKRTDFPGKEIARLVQNKWDKNFVNEIKIVVGDEWFAGNLSYHLISRPKWTLILDEKASQIDNDYGVIYTGNPQILKSVCPGVFGTIKPVGYCMIGRK